MINENDENQNIVSTTTTLPSLNKNTSYPKEKIKVLLLENIHASAVELFKSENYQVESIKSSLPTDQLIEKIKDVHIIGIRSKTKLSANILEHASRLLAIGCFCIGTDQVDLQCAEKRGIAVFNSPFANTRSVAELVLGEVISLARKLGDCSRDVHSGVWNKSATGCVEIRGKMLGIVGYGHVGTQASVLAEALGMSTQFYDVEPKLSLGRSRRCDTLENLLRTSDFVTLHVPLNESTRNLITKREIEMMKPGSFLLNASRGQVVDVNDLADALRSGRLGGAAVDVYPSEPEANSNDFVTPLQGCPNTILTPHIGGSTEEAQEKIGEEVAISLRRYINEGTSMSSVNFPNLNPTTYPGCHRLLNIHHNKPGVLRAIYQVLGQYNISAEILGTTKNIGYMIVDVDEQVSKDVKRAIHDLDANIKTRILY